MNRDLSSFRSATYAASLLGLFLLCPLALVAGPGKMVGRVLDREANEPLIGANVIISHRVLSSGAEVVFDLPLGGSTDAEGYFLILNVPPGVYSVKASMVGYTPLIKTLIRVESDRTIEVNFELASTVLELEAIVVTAQRETIRPDVASTQEVIATSRLEQMPVTRVDEFVNRLKGVELVSGAEGHGLSVRGGSIRETDIRLDGISLQDPRSENSYLALNSTTIQEIQVLTGGFEAKYGGVRSGLLNVVTKDGSRERYSVSLKMDLAPANQQRFFGTSPWSNDSWIYRVFAGEYAWAGTIGDTTVPLEFQNFRGWSARPQFQPQSIRFLDSLQRLDLWKRQHPQYSFGNKPDLFVEGSMTGPFPGQGLPIVGPFAENTTFLLGFKYEDSQLSFPLGPRRTYNDWNTQLKLTTNLGSGLRLAMNGMYAKVSTVSGGQTTSYGGALVDASSSFNFLNNTESSVRQQARLLAGDNLWQMFNMSRLQFYDQQYVVGGAKLTHTLAPNAFYTLDFQVGYTDQQLQPFALDTNRADAWIEYYDTAGQLRGRFLNSPLLGSPNASTNPGTDALNMFRTYGGLQRVDSSYSWVAQLKGDLTVQLGRHHQVETGFSVRMQNLFVYTGTWLQAQLSFTPDLWQYFRARPIDGGLYIQDKLEFEGMIMNAGVRVDYLNPQKRGYEVGIPPDEDFPRLYNEVYQNLTGGFGSFERWLQLRDMLENPPGWPQTENRVQVHVSPRAGVSFPVTENSKLYFNYGHFYQRPPISFMYNQVLDLASVVVPSPDLEAARTVSYEFGYEQMFFDEVLFNVTAYYKDIKNEPLSRTYYNYYHDNIVRKYVPDAYGDIRGVELRLERPLGRYVTFHAMFDYMLQSRGQSGLARIYENRLEARDELRSANLSVTEPRPRGNVTLNLFTPPEWEFFGLPLFNDIMMTFFFEWRDGGKVLWNPEEPDIKSRIYVEAVDYWNIDFRGSKMFRMGFASLELVATVKNLTNNKWLVPENMLRTQYDAYKASLRLPHQGGSDQWGQWKSDDGHIDVGWWTAPIFLNPRRIILGLRLNF
ncbi:MAG: TonB-dependent receptor [Ignavibacteriales bacterium]|nr:TonB-dependent receptor [Ignavibacteriales bacterium]